MLVASTFGDGARVADEELVDSDDGAGGGVFEPVSVVVGEGFRVGVGVGVTASAVIIDITVGASSFSPVGKPLQLEIVTRMLRLKSAGVNLPIGLLQGKEIRDE
jgi:hypothetical protein